MGVKLALYEQPIAAAAAYRDEDGSGLHVENYAFLPASQQTQISFNPASGNVHVVASEAPLQSYDSRGSISDVPAMLRSYVYLEIESGGGVLENLLRPGEQLSELVVNVGSEHYAMKRELAWRLTTQNTPYLAGWFKDIFAPSQSSTTDGRSCL